MFRDPNYSAPFYWSAFTTHGDFLNKPELQMQFDYARYSAVLVFVILVFGIGLTVRKLKLPRISG